MKPWLVEFHLIPRPLQARAASRSTTQPAVVVWSAQRPLPADFTQRVAALGLPSADSGEATLRAWGRPDGNRLELRETVQGEKTVRVSVDTRRLDPGFAAALLALVKASNAMLVRSDGLLIDGTVGAFSRALRSSPAWAHVDDPTGLLTGREPADEEDEP